MRDLVKRFDAEVATKGDVFHIPNVSNLSANDKTAGSAVTLQAVTENKDDLNMNYHKEASFTIDDISKVQANNDLIKIYTTQAGRAIAKAIDTSLMSLYSSITNTAGTYGVSIDDSTLLRAGQYLDDADADDNDRSCVIKPACKADILKIDKFTRADWAPYIKESTAPIRSGKLIGDIYGVMFYVTTNVQSTAGTPTQYHNMLFQKEAFALGIQKNIRTQSDYILEYLATLVVCDVIYGCKLYRDDHAVLVKA